nr:MAG TPA: hypothetical protein [Caudoviricetes sp.]
MISDLPCLILYLQALPRRVQKKGDCSYESSCFKTFNSCI